MWNLVDPAPFFILSSWRSGSTLLALQLGAHPLVTTFLESRWFANVAPVLLANQRELSPHFLYEVLSANGYQSQIELSPEALEEVLTPWPSSVHEILPRLLWESVRDSKGTATTWGEKSCVHALYVPTIAQTFPTARFIHLVRDPRATVNSMAKPTFRDASSHVSVTTHSYYRFNHAIAKSLSRLPSGRWLRVYYERLATDPEAELQRCCFFLGIPFDQAVLRHQERQRDIAGLGSEKATLGVTPKFIGEWRESLTAGQVHAVEVLTRRLEFVAEEYPRSGRAPLVGRTFKTGVYWVVHLPLSVVEWVVGLARGRPFVWAHLGQHLAVVTRGFRSAWRLVIGQIRGGKDTA